MNAQLPNKFTAESDDREPVSAFVVCYNEEANISDCLKSLSFCDEIVVIDSFSKDRTVEICRQLGAKVIQRPWPGYKEQKAFGLATCSHEWIINLDADERVSDELRENVLRVLREERRRKLETANCPTEEINGYSVNRVVYYLGRWWRRGGWYPEYRVRFLRKSKTVWGGIDPHEKPIVDGRIAQLPGEILHFTYRSMEDQLQRLQNFAAVAAREDHKRGRRSNLFLLLVNPFLRTFKFYILKKGYREGTAGLIVSVFEGYYTFMKYAKLWEHELRESSGQEETVASSSTTSAAASEHSSR